MALPDQLFYNTGISTYVWVLSNRREPRRQGKAQLIDERRFFVKMRKSLGNKRNELSQEQIDDLTRIHGNCHGRRDAQPYGRRPRHARAAHTAARGEQAVRQRGVRLPKGDRGAAAASQLRRHPGTHLATRGREGLPDGLPLGVCGGLCWWCGVGVVWRCRRPGARETACGQSGSPSVRLQGAQLPARERRAVRRVAGCARPAAAGSRKGRPFVGSSRRPDRVGPDVN